eukprot:TRINITY_DN2828_c0_g3_i1.p1 TRINITY_DN2828_c0_g3~~TRINITY_DN2828_c0_g3_i1.p1  ORF type:complete len:552 (+),score=122.51 TRINITY_DN2828_c0_g3_i1:138-1793(+)
MAPPSSKNPPGASPEPQVPVSMDPPAGGLEMPKPTPPLETERFPGESMLTQDERQRRLILHVALPRTIMTQDMAAGLSTEAELNDALSTLAWGSVDIEQGEWTLESPDPSTEPPHSSLISYAEYVERTYPSDHTMEDKAREENAHLAAQKRAAFTCPGEPGAKFRPMFDQMVKNIQHSNKALAKAYDIKKVILNEDDAPEDPNKTEAQNIMRFGRHQILPSFWHMLVQLTKRGRRFSVIFRSFNREQLSQAQKELQLFCAGQHPAYSGQHKTQKPPLMDGNKASKDYTLTDANIGSFDRMSDNLLFKDSPAAAPSAETANPAEGGEAAPDEGSAPQAAAVAFKPKSYSLKPLHEAYAGIMHEILETSNTAAIVDDLAFWETNDRKSTAGKLLMVDHAGGYAETKVQHIFFDGNIRKGDAHCVDVRDVVSGDPIPFSEAEDVFCHRVDLFQAVTDIDYFLKATEACEMKMSQKILESRRSAGLSQAAELEEKRNSAAAASAMPPKEWLYRNIIPALLPALEACQRDRPEDPIEFIAFYMLRHSKQYSKTLTS